MRSLRSQLSLWLRRLANRLTPRTQAAPPDDPLLDDLIEHVAYEMAAMAAAAKLWKSSGLWIALEDFLLHARVLREFFWKPWYAEDRHASSAVHAEHYYPPWRGRSGGPPPCFRLTKDAVDRQLAHIARERVTDAVDLANEVEPMTVELWKVWVRFLARLSGDARARKFKSALRSACTKLGVSPPPGAV